MKNFKKIILIGFMFLFTFISLAWSSKSFAQNDVGKSEFEEKLNTREEDIPFIDEPTGDLPTDESYNSTLDNSSYNSGNNLYDSDLARRINKTIRGGTDLVKYLARELAFGNTNIAVRKYYSLTQLQKAIDEANFQNQLILEHDILDGNIYQDNHNWYVRIKFFISNPVTRRDMQRKLLDKAEAVLKQLVVPNDKIQTMYNINNYLVNAAEYDTEAFEKNLVNSSRLATGPLFDGKAICSGYSRAFNLLSTMAGYENIVELGDAKIETNNPNENKTEYHAWNMVKVNNEWYMVDVTWNDNDDLDNAFLFVPRSIVYSTRIPDFRVKSGEYIAINRGQSYNHEYYHKTGMAVDSKNKISDIFVNYYNRLKKVPKYIRLGNVYASDYDIQNELMEFMSKSGTNGRISWYKYDKLGMRRFESNDYKLAENGIYNRDRSLRAGWYKSNGKKYYYDKDGQDVKGIKKIDGSTYYFRKDGSMHRGWLTLKGKRYVFTDSGKMVTGWRTISGNRYYFRKDGSMHKGWLKLNNKTYVFTDSGKMVTGWRTISGNRYYFRKDGSMHTGWLKLNNKVYVFTNSGKMVTGWRTISGNRYYFKKDGSMHKGWLKLNNKTYVFTDSGKMVTGWKTIGGSKYYFEKSGVMHIGWLELSGKKYYLQSNGKMAKGKLKIGNKFYTFDKNGVLIK
ncbi:MAG: transglutaminase domain-containing protein [Tissierellia bacterium]|nr:transglutaminase domain-containing protein [Tissierellia bacterium]